MQEEEQKIPDKETGTEEKLIQAKKEIQLLNNQLESAMKSIDKLIRKLTELENSKLIKFRKYFYHYLAKLRSNFKKGEKKNIFSILVNYVFGRGAHILRFLISKILKALYLLFEIKNVIIVEVAEGFLATSTDYSQYLYRKQITKNRLKFMQKQISSFEKKPLFSIIIPVYDPPVEFLQQALDSVIKQIYPPYEICIADDCSNDPEVKKTLDEYIQKYPSVMVVYRTENGHISKATNTALELATGEYAVFMDQDDILREDTLFHMAALINKQEKVDLIYTDEDKIDEWNIHKEPHFKPDWSPDNLLSRNYFGHICAYRLDQVRMLNGFRVGYEGSQDYDLALRYTERFTSIYHIPEVLYHWRIHSESAAAGEFAKPYAYRSAQRALSEAFMRRGWPARIEFLEGFRGYAARLEILDKNKLVSIILPAKNKAGYLDRCLYSIDAKSTYRNFEIILIDNNSDEDDFFRIVNKYKDKRSFTLFYGAEGEERALNQLMKLPDSYTVIND